MGGGGVDGTTKHGERVDGTTNLRGRWMVQLTWGEGGRQILERVHDYINFEVLQGNLQLLLLSGLSRIWSPCVLIVMTLNSLQHHVIQ